MAWPNTNDPTQMDPMSFLAAKAQANQQQQPQADIPAQGSQPAQGQMPQGAPAQAPAATPPAPVSAPSGGGGIFGNMGGLGTALTNAMSGAGLFGTLAGNDDKIDPTTGVTAGQSARMNNMGIMKMGLMLIAAGQRQSDDSRARILGSIPSALDTSSQINSFASNRLKLAQIKLLEQETARQQAGRAMWAGLRSDGTFGPTPGAAAQAPSAPAVAATAPTAGGTIPGAGQPAPAPAPAAPSGPVPQAGPAGQGPMMGVIQQGERFAQPIPLASGQTQTAEAPAPAAQSPDVPATGATPAGGDGQTQELGTVPEIRVGAPPPPAAPTFQLSDAERNQISSFMSIADAATQKQMQHDLAKRREDAIGKEYYSDNYFDPGSGQMSRDVYQKGKKVKTEVLGQQLQPRLQIWTDPTDGTRYNRKVLPNGQVVSQEPVVNKKDDLYSAKEAEVVFSERKKLADQRDAIADVQNDYNKVMGMAANVRNNKVIVGTLAGTRQKAAQTLRSLGFLSDEGAKKLEAGADVNALVGGEAGKFAKENFGPQVSDNDVRVAKEITGAFMGGSDVEVARALERVAELKARSVEQFRKNREAYQKKIPQDRNQALYNIDDVEFQGRPTPNAQYHPELGWIEERNGQWVKIGRKGN